jgi:hypothetical protein
MIIMKVKKYGKVFPVFNYLRSTPWRHMGKWGYSSAQDGGK